MTTWTGVDSATGEPIADRDHIRQSVMDILQTRPGQRVMRPEYGSNLLDLVSRPVNQEWLLDLYYEAIVAIHRHEPRVRIIRIRGELVAEGRVSLDMAVTIDGEQAEQLRIAALTL